MTPRTLYDKVWDRHVVKDYDDEHTLLYIDRHLVQEVSSPQAFEGLDQRPCGLRRSDAHIAVADHAISTQPAKPNLKESLACKQIERLEQNSSKYDMPYIAPNDLRHGIVHVIGPELGFTLPGCTLVCGDSHTSTHGAFGALAFGIGSSECEMVFAAQALKQKKQKQMRVTLDGTLAPGVSIKDVILALIARIGTAGARGYAIEYAGNLVRGLSMEARMTLCNMTIEAGARIGMIAPDETTFDYLQGRPLAPSGNFWNRAVADWKQLVTDADAKFDKEIAMDVSTLAPYVSWGTTPAESAPVTENIPTSPIAESADEQWRQTLSYMNIRPGTPLTELTIDKVFIGSCTNSRIEDLQSAAAIIKGRKIAPGVSAMIVPGSAAVQAQAEAEGLDKIFLDAGMEWRTAGCSMCVAMNNDRLRKGERCASTSNRNFEGRQGPGGRTHLMSPAMAAAAAIKGHIADVRELMETINA